MTKANHTIPTIAVLAALLALARPEAVAYTFMPLVTCYSAQEQRCSTQAWAATQDDRGTMYFATSDGVLIYDGVNWQTVDIEGAATMRSVLADGDRIYVGAYEQMGYLTRDGYGGYDFHSLKGLAGGYDWHDDQFWKILKHDGRIYFQSFRSILDYDGEAAVSAYCDEELQPLYLFDYRGKLYCQMINRGLYAAAGRGFRQVLPLDSYGGSFIVAMLDCGGQEAILCTESAGLYRYDPASGRLAHMPTAVDRELRANSINRAIMMADGTIALGTIRNGLYCIGQDGSLRCHYNIDNGLGNNSILGLYEDSTHNLWVMMDYGISLVHTGLPYTCLTPDAEEPRIGMTYDTHRDGDRLYIGTNQGIYTYSFANHTLTGSNVWQSQIWHIDSFDGQMFIGGGIISKQILPDGRTISEVKNSTDIKRGIIHNRDVLVEASYYRLRIYERQPNGRWAYSHEVADFGMPVRKLEIDSDGSLWCSHMSQGVVHLELTPDLREVARIDTVTTAGTPRMRPTSFVMKIRGQLVVSDGDSLYQWDAAAGALRVMAGLHADLPTVREVYGATAVDDNLFWLSSRKSYTLVAHLADGHYRSVLTIPLDRLSLQTNGENNKVRVDAQRNSYFSINNSVGCVPLDSLPAAVAAPTMAIAAVECVDRRGEVRRLPLAPGAAPARASGNVEFRLSYPSYNFTSPRFVYTLAGPTAQRRCSDKPEAAFVELRHGNYRFHAAMIDDSGEVLATVEYAFVVPTPPFLAWWAMTGYALALVVLIVAFSKLYSRRQVSRQRRKDEIERMEQNVKILEQERIIAEQQKQILQNELSVKGKELASIALESSYKHQVIQGLKETLSAQSRKGQIESKEIDALIRTINSDIGTTEFWTIFQNNFDLIHDNFFRNLRQRYPTLTPTDLKFCALLRLNMSTKDIAYFTHLSVRGVETARYRLRRKLGLDGKASIVQFLIDFK